MATHTISLNRLEPQFKNASGSRTSVTKANFPVLQNMAIYRLLIAAGCFREPHWHPNADELAYCLSGKVLVTIFSNGNQHDHFTISKGEMFYVPSGSLHAIENIGEGTAELIITFSSATPEDFGLSGTAGCMSLEVIANTWGKKVSEIGSVTRSVEDIILGKTSGNSLVPASAEFANRLKFPVEAKSPTLVNSFGLVRVARKDTWSALRALAMYSLDIHGNGMREPHWHPETAELGYVVAGRARMTIKGPENAVDTYTLQAGDIYFIPRAYPHHIENLTEGEMRFLIFFDTPNVQDIGFTGAIPAFPGRIVGPTLGIADSQLPEIPVLPSDELIVGKMNPFV
jgi:oxalate decarboxylase